MLLDFHEGSNSFLYLNPADTTGTAYPILIINHTFHYLYQPGLKSISMNLLDLARSHEGTDGDIILCSKSQLPYSVLFPPSTALCISTTNNVDMLY